MCDKKSSPTSWINVAFSYLHLTARGEIYISRVRETYLKFVHPVFEGRRRAEQVHVKFVLPVWLLATPVLPTSRNFSFVNEKRGANEKNVSGHPYFRPNSGRRIKRKVWKMKPNIIQVFLPDVIVSVYEGHMRVISLLALMWVQKLTLFYSSNLFWYTYLKGKCHEIFCFWFFSWISFPQAPEYTIRAVSKFFENSRIYSQLKVDHWYQRHRWQICHRYQWHPRQILPPILLVLLIPVANLPPVSTIPAANLPPVSTTPVANCHRYQRHRQQICQRCQRHRWQTIP